MTFQSPATAVAARPATDPNAWAGRLADLSVRRPRTVIAFWAVLTIIGLFLAVTRFAITTDTQQLLTPDTPWIHNKTAFREAFPQLANPILAVVEAPSPELAEASANRLATALTEKGDGLVKAAWRPDGGPFFDKNGLLFLPVEEVRRTLDGLVSQQTILSALSGDPTLRGLLRLVQLGADRGALGENAGLLGGITTTIERVLAGEPARLSWQALLSGGNAPGGGPGTVTRKFVLVDPVLDFKALEPAARVTARIHSLANDLGLTADKGVRVRLTGAPPLADEEFATLREGAPLHLGLTVVAIAVILYFALKSGRVIAAVLITTFAGLIITVGAGLLMVGRFNVISVAVAALFLGLGVDFAIQVAVRYRDERYKRDEVGPAIQLAARGIGWSLTLAAASLVAGFFAFLPTTFKGVSELGLITGVGMIIAFVSSLTLLPALLMVLNPPGEPETVETQALVAVDHWILRNRKLVIGASTVLVLLGLPLLFKLEFDANPMNLRSAKSEAVATFLDLTRQPGMTPNTISVLAPSAEAAREIAPKLGALPEVTRVVSVSTLVPPDQDAKLALIQGAAGQLSSLLLERPPAPAPTDEELIGTARGAAASLERRAATNTPEAAEARRLAAALTKLAEASPAVRAKAQEAVAGDLPTLLARVRALLGPERVTTDTLPASLRDDWLAKDGRARVEVSPSGDANDNAVLDRFSAAVLAVAPNASGAPIDIVESRGIIVQAFVVAGLLALGAVFVLLTVALRRPVDVALTLGPLVIATALTLEAAHLLGMPLNLANIIALPLMLAVGVNFHIYYMIAWREGVADMLASSLTRAIFFSALTTGVAFGSLWLSNHPGTASMGKLLTLSLFFTLLAAFIIVPAFLGPPREEAAKPGAGLKT